MARRPVKVLVVDDSPIMRAALMRTLSQAEGITVVDGAKDVAEARDRIIRHRPDVIVLDTVMPGTDGLTFLQKLLVHYPVPVIMCADPARADHRDTLRAIELGATDVMVKPARAGLDAASRAAMKQFGGELIYKVSAAAAAVRRPPPAPPATPFPPISLRASGLDPSRYLVVIGASTGGTEAIKNLLTRVPTDFPPCAIVQHMPRGFTGPFAQRLDQLSPIRVSEALDGQPLRPGMAVIAPGGRQMALAGAPAQWRIELGSTELVNRHCPAVDVLFRSVASLGGRFVVGVLLTGMGSDGAEGLLVLRRAGAITVGQNHKSCVVYGMPKAAADLGAVQLTGAPEEIPRLIVQALRSRDAAVAPMAE